MSTGKLNGKGFKQYWISLSSELKVEDTRKIEKSKNEIINEYFEQQREICRINQERNKITKDRFSLPRTLSTDDNGRKNSRGNHRRVDRSKSVPAANSSRYNKKSW